MPSFLRIPKIQLALTLILIYLTVFKFYPVVQSLFVLIVSLGSVILFDLVFTLIRRRTLFIGGANSLLIGGAKNLFIPYAAIVTGLIIALIIDPEAKWYQIAVVSGIAMGAKNFIRVSDRHIFNPAAIGLFVGGIIFSQYVAWWGVSFQSIRQVTLLNLVLFLILLSPAVVSAYRMRRIYSIITFILTYTVFSHIFTFTLSIQSIINRMFDPTVLFFSLVMLPEPMTSPVTPKRQVLYGIIVALIVQLIAYPSISSSLTDRGLLPDLFILALLLGNLLFFKFR